MLCRNIATFCVVLILLVADRAQAEAIASLPVAPWDPQWSAPVTVVSMNISSLARIVVSNTPRLEDAEMLITMRRAHGGWTAEVLPLKPVVEASTPIPAGDEAQLSQTLLASRDTSLDCTSVTYGPQSLPMLSSNYATCGAFVRNASSGLRHDVILGVFVPRTSVLSIRDRHASVGTVTRIAGDGSCDYNQSDPTNTTVASMSPLSFIGGIAQHPTIDGSLFVSQRCVVVEIDSSGVLTYFFGDADRCGEYNHTFNAFTIKRWDATTRYPTHMAVDEQNQTLYVAESGFNTIRAVNVKTGDTSVIVGTSFLYIENLTFPPTCEPNCSASSLTLLSVSGVAVHWSSALQQTWLFVSDYTNAMIIRVIVETGLASVVAGVSLEYRRPYGLGIVRNIAIFFDVQTSRGYLFFGVAHVGVKRITWIEPQPPSPTTAPATAVEKAADGVATTVVIAGTVLGGVAVMESIAMITIGSVQCSAPSSAKNDVVHQVFFFFADSIPASAEGWVYLLLVATFAAIHAALMVVFRYVWVTDSITDHWAYALSRCRFPAASIVAAEALFPLAV